MAYPFDLHHVVIIGEEDADALFDDGIVPSKVIDALQKRGHDADYRVAASAIEQAGYYIAGMTEGFQDVQGLYVVSVDCYTEWGDTYPIRVEIAELEGC